jgi:DNA topoisomerase VI subunit A
VSIENATTFHELCRLGCSDLLILTSYPNKATVDLLLRLSGDLPLYHWGDTDPWGFDVLRDLRRKTTRVIAPLHMFIGNWAETLPSETRARRELTPLDRQKLSGLLNDDDLLDVREELRIMEESGITGDFEQEGLQLTSALFPYVV